MTHLILGTSEYLIYWWCKQKYPQFYDDEIKTIKIYNKERRKRNMEMWREELIWDFPRWMKIEGSHRKSFFLNFRIGLFSRWQMWLCELTWLLSKSACSWTTAFINSTVNAQNPHLFWISHDFGALRYEVNTPPEIIFGT